MAFSKSGMLAIGDMDGSTYLWDVAAGDTSATLTDPASGGQGVGAVALTRTAGHWPPVTPMAPPFWEGRLNNYRR